MSRDVPAGASSVVALRKPRNIPMKSLLIVLSLVASSALLGGCCCMKDSDQSAEMMLCADCGMEKGSKGCCDPAAEHCVKCGMIKGSPGCCK
jgi:hypothetical protein